MKKVYILLLVLALGIGILAGCREKDAQQWTGVQIHLSDDAITVNGKTASEQVQEGVHVAQDIVYYEEGKDFTYGEGTAEDSHSQEEAEAHTVVHISQPGQYVVSGSLSKGQIAIDLGEDAEEDPNAVVTLVLNGVDITCHVAPAVIFYNVYECGEKNEDTAVSQVDTTAAGANVIIADGTENTVTGSYVARIYKPESIVLNDDGTEVEDAKKLHKYDGAFYSKMSMNIDGGEKDTGVLNIHATNEGLDSELHLTINGGNIRINSGNDGINTNEDYISVTTINGGNVDILVNGQTGEGDGIDSNGWLVINGGTVRAQACSFSGDAGIDSDMGIHIYGGTVVATGNMLDQIAESDQNYAVFTFSASQSAGAYCLKNQQEKTVAEVEVENAFSYMIISMPELTAGAYTLWAGDAQLQGMAMGSMGGRGDRPFMEDWGGEPPELPEGMTPPEGMELPEGMEPQDGMTPPEGMERPEGMQQPDDQIPGGRKNSHGGFGGEDLAQVSQIFTIQDGGNYFQVIGIAE